MTDPLKAESHPIKTARVESVENLADPEARASWPERVVSLTIALSVAAVTVVARILTPDASGTGTHEQLGLPPCGLYETFGIPCLSCGWTTAWANMAHFRPLAALAASPFGALLYVIVLAAATINLYSALTGWPVFRKLERLDWTKIGLVMLVLVLGSWVYKLVVVLQV